MNTCFTIYKSKILNCKIFSHGLEYAFLNSYFPGSLWRILSELNLSGTHFPNHFRANGVINRLFYCPLQSHDHFLELRKMQYRFCKLRFLLICFLLPGNNRNSWNTNKTLSTRKGTISRITDVFILQITLIYIPFITIWLIFTAIYFIEQSSLSAYSSP